MGNVTDMRSVSPSLADRDDADTVIEWTYNDDGTVDVMTKEDDTEIAYTYDNAGRVTQVDVTRATGVAGTTQQTFSYDPAGRRVSATDNNDPNRTDDDVTATWAYDSLGRLVEESQTVGSGGTARTVTYNYTSTRRSALIYPNSRQVDYAYHDFGGALETISDNGGSEIARYEYIGGRALKREMANGVDLDMRDGSGGTLYDALGRPTEWKHFDTNQAGDPLAIGFSYGYDAVGNKRWQRVLHNTDDSQRYAYDSASRLTAFVRGNFGATDQDWCDDPAATQLPAGMTQAREWTLDGVGNWSQTRTKVGGSIATESRSDTTFNEYSSIGGTAQTHDANGNLTDDGTHLYEWDGLNRLVSVSDKAPQATIVSYAYDTGNRRMLVDEATASTSDTVYCYGGWQVLEEAPQSAPGAPDRQFVYGNYIDEALVMNTDGNADGDCLDAGADPAYYYLQNTLYSVYALADASGVVVEAYSYDPYGNHTLHLDGPDAGSAVDFSSDDLRFAEGRSPNLNPYGFTGRRFDRETGLWHYRNRPYRAERGRFVSRDPIGYREGPNLYLYVECDPASFVDALGLAKEEGVSCALSGDYPHYEDENKIPQWWGPKAAPGEGKSHWFKNGRELFAGLKACSKGKCCIKTLYIFSHGWSGRESSEKRDGGVYGGGGSNTGFYGNGYRSPKPDARNTDDLAVKVKSKEIKFCSPCGIIITACEMQYGGFVHQLGKVTGCTVDYAKGKCSGEGTEKGGPWDALGGWYRTGPDGIEIDLKTRKHRVFGGPIKRGGHRNAKK